MQSEMAAFFIDFIFVNTYFYDIKECKNVN